MSTTSKSPRTVAACAMAVGARTLTPYAHRFSPRTYTQPQLFTILVLRKFFRTDYRGIAAILADMPALCKDLKLRRLPHYTTLQKAEARLLQHATIRDMLGASVELYLDDEAGDDDDDGEDDPPLRPAYVIDTVAADSTGFELDRCSRYFVRRRARGTHDFEETTYRTYGKLGIVADCDTHLILSTLPGEGPRVDVDELHPLISNICGNVIPEALVADAGYDSEENHRMLRDYLEIASHIPAKARRHPQTLPRGKWRFVMAVWFDEELYGRRWQAETVMFMLKRHQGAALTARTPATREREMNLMAVTHNLMILLRVLGELFYRAGLTPGLGPLWESIGSDPWIWTPGFDRPLDLTDGRWLLAWDAHTLSRRRSEIVTPGLVPRLSSQPQCPRCASPPAHFFSPA